MRAFDRIEAVAAPLVRPNIDTDLIISGDHCMKVSNKGFAEGLFANWRYLTGPGGYVRDGGGALVPDESFVLNQPAYRGAEILLGGVNFACGSSREHAVWALHDWGIRAVIAPSFGNIFYANCFKNGLLPVTLPLDAIEAIAAEVAPAPQANKVIVDLVEMVVVSPSGTTYRFEIGEFYRLVLLEGLNPIDAVLRYEEEIGGFQAADRGRRPWIYGSAA